MKKGIIIYSFMFIILLASCSDKSFTKNIKDIDLKRECLKEEYSKKTYNDLPIFQEDRDFDVGIKIAKVINDNSAKTKCYLDQLEIDTDTDKVLAIQRVYDYIVLNINDKEDRDGIKHPNDFIYDKEGDCEDEAMFALSLFEKLGIEVNIAYIKEKSGHVFLAFEKDDKFENMESIEFEGKEYIVFDPISSKVKKNFSFITPYVLEKEKSNSLDIYPFKAVKNKLNKYWK